MFFAYEKNCFNSIVFLVFVIVAIFFLLNILVAIVFDNYKQRVAERREYRLLKRIHYVEMYFEIYDSDKNGYLDLQEAKSFFSYLFDLTWTKHAHRKTFLSIMKIVDPENNKIVFKDRCLEFFAISGWKIMK
jgi:two pore calcium channel protein, plant